MVKTIEQQLAWERFMGDSTTVARQLDAYGLTRDRNGWEPEGDNDSIVRGED